ncbi:hypothetical protein F4604DRAFT_1674387 [Suillus subluteus]|nr:hypothetical protein F4604DRAFT_1674387 [Suillus subluteus]
MGNSQCIIQPKRYLKWGDQSGIRHLALGVLSITSTTLDTSGPWTQNIKGSASIAVPLGRHTTLTPIRIYGPLVEDSERTEYQVLVPIYGFTQQDDKMLYNINMVSRVLKHKLILVWMWPDCASLYPPLHLYLTYMSSGTQLQHKASTMANGILLTTSSYDPQLVIVNISPDNPWTTVIWWFKICIVGSLVVGSTITNLITLLPIGTMSSAIACSQNQTLRMLTALETQLVSDSGSYTVNMDTGKEI